MEIDYRRLASFRGEDVIQITSLTESNKFPMDACVLEAIIEMNDGNFYRVIADDTNRKDVTREVLNLMRRASIKQRLVPGADGMYDEFVQCEKGNRSDERKYGAVYDEYLENSKKGFPKAALVGVGAGVGTVALAATGIVAYNHFKDKEETPEVDFQLEENVQKPEIKGTSIEFYLENAPESEQLTFEQSFYPAFDSLNTRMAEHTYTSESGTFGRLGLTVPQARLLYLTSHNYSDEQIAEIMGGELFNQIPMVDNDGNPVLDENGNQVMEDSTVIMQQAYEVFQQWFKDAPLNSEDINAVTSFFDTEHDKEIVRRFITGHNAVLEATTDEAREEAAKNQRELYDRIFASDITDSDTKVSDEATAFISRTMYVADYELANAYNYTDTELVYRVGTEEAVEVTTNLYGEQFDAWFRSGMQNFDSENYLKRVGKNPDKYYINKSTAVMSITDATCEHIFGKITSANEYIRDLQNADTDIEVSSSQKLAMIEQKLAAGEELTAEDYQQMQDNIKVVSKLDQIKEKTYNIVDIEELMRTKMMNLDRYPVHTEVFAEKWANTVIAIKDSHSAKSYSGSSTGTKKSGTGSNPVTFNSPDANKNREDARTELISRGASPTEAEKMLDKAEEEANKKQGILGKDSAETTKIAEAERDKIQQEAQASYDKAYNYAYNWYSQHGANRGTPADEGSYLSNTTSVDKNDPSRKLTVRDAYNDGKAAGIGAYNNELVRRANNGDKEAEKEARNLGLITGGEEKVDSGLSDYIEDGSLSTDGDTDKTASDVIKDSNNEDANKNNTKPEVTNPGITMPPPPPEEEVIVTPPTEEQPDVGENELPPGFVPIVDGNGQTGGNQQIWSEEDILKQIEQIMQQEDQAKTQADATVVEQAIEEVAQELMSTQEPEIVVEQPQVSTESYEGGEMQIDPSLLDYVTFDEEVTEESVQKR